MTTEDHTVQAIRVSAADALLVEQLGLHLVPPHVAATLTESGSALVMLHAEGIAEHPEHGLCPSYGTWIMQLTHAANLLTTLERCVAALPPADKARWDRAYAHCTEHPDHDVPVYAMPTRTGIGDEPEPADEQDDRCKCGNPNCGAC